MRNFPETGEWVINTKKNSPLRRGVSRVERTIFLCIDHKFTCLREISVIYSDQTGHWSISVPIGSFWRTIYAWEEYIQSSPIFISYEFLYCSREIILLSLSYFSNWFIFPLKKRVTQIQVNMLPYHIHNQYVLPSPMFSCSIPICGSWRTWPFF